jgi:hypothetical protein
MPSLKQSLKRCAKRTAQSFLNCIRKTSSRNSDPISSSPPPRPRVNTAGTKDGLVPSEAALTDVKEASPPPSIGLVPSDAKVTDLKDTSSPSSCLSMTNLFSKYLEGCDENLTEPTNSTLEPKAADATTTDDLADTYITLQMTLDLPSKIQKAALAQRAFEALERKATAERSNATELEMELHTVLSNEEAEVNRLEKSGATEAEIEQSRDLLFRLHVLLDKAQLQERNMRVLMWDESAKLRRLQGEVSACMETALLDANVLQPCGELPETVVESVHVAADIKKLIARRHDSLWGSKADSESPSSAEEGADEGAEDVAEEDHFDEHANEDASSGVSSNYDEPYENLSTEDKCRRMYFAFLAAQQRFDQRDELREHIKQENMDAALMGIESEDATPDDFDIRMVDFYRTLTRKLIEAEENLRQVLLVATQEGLNVELTGIDLMLEEAFVDGDDGYAESLEQELVDCAPVDEVFEWMDGVPTEAATEGEAIDEVREDADEWEADELEFGDDLDTYAVGHEKSRIVRWRNMAPSAPVDQVLQWMAGVPIDAEV